MEGVTLFSDWLVGGLSLSLSLSLCLSGQLLAMASAMPLTWDVRGEVEKGRGVEEREGMREIGRKSTSLGLVGLCGRACTAYGREGGREGGRENTPTLHPIPGTLNGFPLRLSISLSLFHFSSPYRLSVCIQACSSLTEGRERLL